MNQAPTNSPPPGPLAGAGSAITVILQGTALIAPLVSIYAALFMAPLLLIAAVGIGLAAIWQRRPIPVVGRPLLILLGLVVLWGALSSLWSINPKGSIITALQLLALFVSGAAVVGGVTLLNQTEAARIGRWLVTGIIGALIIYTIEITLDSPIQSLIRVRREGLEGLYSPFNRGLSVLVLLLSPSVLALRRLNSLSLSIVVFGATIAIVYVYYGGSVAAGLSCGIIAGTLSYFGSHTTKLLLGGLVAAMILVAPFVAREVLTSAVLDTVGQETTNASVSHRFVIWQFVGGKALERPITGWGLDAARSFPEGKTKVQVTTRSCQPPCFTEVELLPLHTHNMALQWWLELGLPGAALGAIVLFWLFQIIPTKALDRTEQSLLVGQLTAGIAIAGLSYGAWQSWWLATLTLAMAFSVVALRTIPISVSMSSSTRLH